MATGTGWLRLGVLGGILVGPASFAANAVDAPRASERPTTYDTQSVQWQLLAGGLASLDGYSTLGYQGWMIGSGWEFPRLRFRFQFMAGLSRSLVDDRTEVRLEQYALGFGLDTPLLRHGAWRWSVGAGAGLLVFLRSAYALVGGVDAAGPRIHPALMAGPDTSLRWRFSRYFGVESSLAMDIVVGRPIFGFVDSNGFDPLREGWAVRPRLNVALVVFP